MTSRLVLSNVTLRAGAKNILSALSLAVRGGEVVTIMGPSGSGKSSLLAFICGTLDLRLTASGAVELDGLDLTHVPAERRRVGILFQDDVLFPHMTVGGNLAFGLPKVVRDRRAHVEAALKEAELEGFADRDPATLSGGQRARVSLMRVLLSEPKALLLDEPFSKLDAPLRQSVRAFVFDHARSRKIPVLFVTHDPADATAAGGPVVTLGNATER